MKAEADTNSHRQLSTLVPQKPDCTESPGVSFTTFVMLDNYPDMMLNVTWLPMSA